MKSEDVLVVVAVLAVIVSFVGLGFTYSSVMSYKNLLTGFATDTGTVNITIDTNTAVNFTTDNVDFGSGAVDALKDFAVMSTESSCSGDNCSTNSWDQPSAFVIENIGNINVTANVSFSTDADGLLAGSSPEFQYKMSETTTDSCVGTLSAGTYRDANTTETSVCDNFGFYDDDDELSMDIRLLIPYDSNTGDLGAVVSFNYESV